MPAPTNLLITGMGAGSVVASSFSVDALGRIVYGDRILRASKVLPQTATEALFNIVGGPVMLLQILGLVTVVIQTQANNAKLQANPTVTGSSVDICANLDITAKAVGTYFGITGTFATAMQSGLSIVAQTTPVILPVGTLDLVTAASNTGEVSWTAYYVPLMAGAVMTAA